MEFLRWAFTNHDGDEERENQLQQLALVLTSKGDFARMGWESLVSGS
jgi:hypothetical protein